MKHILLITAFFALAATTVAQNKFEVYNPSENAAAAISTAVSKASKEKKHVLIQVGGNWCSWCARFHKLITEDAQIDSLIKSSFIVYHLNYSKENKNLPALAKYRYPQRFGFPVFLILDGKGTLLHTQNSVYLEEGKGYSKNKILDFLNGWTPAALNPAKYKD